MRMTKRLTKVSPYGTTSRILVAHFRYGAGVLTGEGNTPAHRRNPSIDISAVGNLDEGFCRQRSSVFLFCIFRVALPLRR